MSFEHPPETKFAKRTTIKVSVSHSTPTRRDATNLRYCFTEFFEEMDIPKSDWKIEIIKHN